MEDTREITILGRPLFGNLCIDKIISDFESEVSPLPLSNPMDNLEVTRRHTGVAKDRRLARKKRAQKLSRRR